MIYDESYRAMVGITRYEALTFFQEALGSGGLKGWASRKMGMQHAAAVGGEGTWYILMPLGLVFVGKFAKFTSCGSQNNDHLDPIHAWSFLLKLFDNMARKKPLKKDMRSAYVVLTEKEWEAVTRFKISTIQHEWDQWWLQKVWWTSQGGTAWIAPRQDVPKDVEV